MTRILFIGDGPRDENITLPLVENLLRDDSPVSKGSSFSDWHVNARVHKGRFRRKFLFIQTKAKADNFDGIVAVVDRDKCPGREKLTQLDGARCEFRSKHAPFPTAIGEAAPCHEAWIVGDLKALSIGLNLKIESHDKSLCLRDPKGFFNTLFEQTSLAEDGITAMQAMAHVSRQVNVKRCINADESGLQRFVEEVHAEFVKMPKISV